MVQILEVVSTYGYLIGGVTFLAYLLKAAIDFWFVTELEKKLMTDYQKLKGFISKLIITIIPNVLITIVITFFTNQEFLTQQEKVNETFLIAVFLSLLFLINIGLNVLITLVEKGLNLKSDYVLSIDNEEWCIKRLTKNNLLLLINKEDEYLLIEEWKDKRIKKLVNKQSYTYKIYSEKSNWIKVVGASICVLTLSVFAFIFYHDTVFSSLLLLVGCLAFLSTLIIIGNLVEYRREYS